MSNVIEWSFFSDIFEIDLLDKDSQVISIVKFKYQKYGKSIGNRSRRCWYSSCS